MLDRGVARLQHDGHGLDVVGNDATRGTEIQQRLTELAMEAGGADAMRISDATGDDAQFAATLGLRYCNFRKTSIYAGSNEIQRNIMAKMMLGL